MPNFFSKTSLFCLLATTLLAACHNDNFEQKPEQPYRCVAASTNSEGIKDHSDTTNFIVEIRKPKSIREVAQIIRSQPCRVSIKGGGYSMGGQIAAENGLVIDMDSLNAIRDIDLKSEVKTITVEAGARWQDVQTAIDPLGLSVKVMQSYNNFSVGGSLSVNAHGRYVGFGPIISSVKSIKIVMANGEILLASRTENPDIFRAAIGGYGAIGVIVEGTLELAENVKIKRTHHRIQDVNTQAAVENFLTYFQNETSNHIDKKPVFMNADLYPPTYETLDAITWTETTEPLTQTKRMQDAAGSSDYFSQLKMSFGELFPGALWLKEKLAAWELRQNPVYWRNYEASYRVEDLQALDKKYRSTNFLARSSLLQEYFVPMENVSAFVRTMCEIFRKSKAKILNVSLRHVPKNDESMLSWSNKEGFALVIYYVQPLGIEKEKNIAHAKQWTQELISEVINVGGTYYLPYQIYGTPEQVKKAYPQICAFLALKKRLDPHNMFTNTLWDTYSENALSCAVFAS